MTTSDSGEVVTVSWMVSAVVDKGGRVHGVLGSMANVRP